MKILAFAGSNSSQSINHQLVTYAGSLLQDAHQMHFVTLADYDAPLYGVDLEQAHGIPESVTRLAADIDAADALLLALPEHNGAYSVAFKNMFDWLSRTPNRNTWSNSREVAKPMVLLATAPGQHGGKSVLEMAANRFPRNGGHVLATFSFPHFSDNFKSGAITNQDKRDQLHALLQQAFC